MINLIIVLFMIPFVMFGCASFSQEKCTTMDYYKVGFEEGRQGEKIQKIYEIEKKCAKFGISPNKAEYLSGWEDGLLVYCTPENGYETGKGGLSYQGACKEHGEAAFLVKYFEGLASFCTAENAFYRGRRGYAFSSACSETQFPQFRREFILGSKIYRLEKRKDNIEMALKRTDEKYIQLNVDDPNYSKLKIELERQMKFHEAEYSALSSSIIELEIQSSRVMNNNSNELF